MKSITVVFDGSPVNYLVDYEGEDIERGELLVVESSRGLELVKALSSSSNSKKEKSDKEQTFEEAIDQPEEEKLSFVRIATGKDKELAKENKVFVDTVCKETRKLVKRYGLEMKISGAKSTLDRSKVVIFFTAENRVDFRELVKELAGIFKTRIELRQIGARDETRIMGGLGQCGKVCCCKEFLNELGHASIKMAKAQNLSLNPSKISGLCGRLLCCLGYENEYYLEASKLMPKINSLVMTPSGRGVVVYNDLLKMTSQVRIESENTSDIKTFELSEIKILDKGNQ